MNKSTNSAEPTVAVVGLGSVGGLIAARLASRGFTVRGVARGDTLTAVRERGLAWIDSQGEQRVRLAAVDDDPGRLGAHDIVVIALKAPALSAMADRLAPLIGPHTTVLPAMNGVPWWFLRGRDDRPLASIDPDGAITRALPYDQTLGCVVHLSASVQAPGVIRHGFGNRLIIGEPRGGAGSDRVRQLAALLRDGGFQVDESDDIRREIWFKLWGNATMNPMSALTGATSDLLLNDPLVVQLTLRAMAEAAEVGARIGCPIAQGGEQRLQLARQLGAFKTSMLQDVEAGRPIELDALVAVVHEIAARVGVATPFVDAVLGLTRVMARRRGLYASPEAPVPPAGV